MIKSFFYTLKQSLLQLVRNKTMALTSLFSITAMLLILGMFFILAVNVNLMTANMEQRLTWWKSTFWMKRRKKRFRPW